MASLLAAAAVLHAAVAHVHADAEAVVTQPLLLVSPLLLSLLEVEADDSDVVVVVIVKR